MIERIVEFYKGIKDNKKGIISLFCVSLIIFMLTVAVYFVADYVMTDSSKKSSISVWDYSYIEKAGITPTSELRIFNAQTPIVTDRNVKKDNIYLTKTFEPSAKKRTLVLISDHSPMKIKINGREVYNNQYETAEFTGNCYNAVTLDSSEREQVVEVFMKLPLSVRFEAFFSNSSNPAFSFSLGFFVGVFIAVLGLVSLAVFVFFSFKRKEKFNTIAFALLLVYTGLSVAFLKLSDCSYILNAPIWLNIQTVFVHLTFIAGVLCALSWFSNRKNYVLMSLGTVGISILLVLVSFNSIVLAISTWLMSALCFLCACHAVNGTVLYLFKRTVYAMPIFVITAYYALMSLLAGVFLYFRVSGMYAFTISVPTLILGGVIEYIHISNYKYKKANSQINEQISRYGDSVKDISYFIKSIFDCNDKDTFFDTAVEQISVLLKKYNNKNNNLGYGVGVKTNNGYKEIINHNLSNCNYEIIEKNSKNNNKNFIFSGFYFDYVLKKESGIYAIIHFENVADGLDMFFESMIDAVYCALATAFKKVYDKHSNLGIDVIFTELAENTEVDNGYSLEHLVHIQKYTKALCKSCDMSDDEASQIGLAAKLHDIGKLAIPKIIINKEGRLTEEEQATISNHAKYGYIILSAYTNEPLLLLAAEIARYHHEKYDGSGPNGLKGEEIPLVARIVTICDVYDALVSERSYKKAWPEDRAKAYILENKGILFDPILCDKFLECISDIEL